jgi:hypothetical protein
METEKPEINGGLSPRSLQACGENSAASCSVSLIGKKKVAPSLIDADLCNAALTIRTLGRQFERVNGTTAEEFLAEVGI